MKKAQEPKNLAENIFSAIKKLTSNGGNNDNNIQQNKEYSPPAPAPQNTAPKGNRLAPQPPLYNYSAYASLIETHNKKIKKILEANAEEK